MSFASTEPLISIEPPLTPPGTKSLISKSSVDRRTWAPNGVDSWYLGRAPKEYRCYRLYVPKTRAKFTYKTVQFLPHQCQVPKTPSVNAAIVAAQALTEALTNPSPAAPYARFGDAQQQAIADLAKIFKSAITNYALPSIIPPQPSVWTVPPPSLRVPIPPASPRVTVPLESPRVNIPPAYPRVKIPPASSPLSPPTVSLTVHLHFIEPDYNGDNINAVTVPHYQLQSHHHKRPFGAQELHYIAANISTMAQPPHFSSGTGSCYARSIWHIITNDHRRTNHSNTVIDTDTGHYL